MKKPSPNQALPIQSASSSTSHAFDLSIPATSANLGPGFDGLGLALNLFNDFHVEPVRRGPSRITGEGECDGLDAGEDNAFFQAMAAVHARAGVKRALPAVKVHVRGRVPMARGLGSSATAIVGGAMAANRLLGNPLTSEELLLVMVECEGHPDNVAPAYMGGLVAAAFDGRTLAWRKIPIHRTWRLAFFVPDYPLETKKARAALPKSVPLGDAVFNLTRTPLVVEALRTGDADLLEAVLADRLHEPYREKLVKGFAAIRAAALGAGAAASYLSGAGPAQAAFCKGAATAERAVEAMAEAACGAGASGAGYTLAPLVKGPVEE